MSEHYFTFPLAVLRAGRSPHESIDLASDCGMLNAGRGYRRHNSGEAFQEKLDAIFEQREIAKKNRPGTYTEEAEILVGAAICDVRLGEYTRFHLSNVLSGIQTVMSSGAFVRMKADYLWLAFKQTKAEEDPVAPWPERGISWREFRILAAILSVKINRSGFAFIGWETIQHRSCGFTSKVDFKNAETIPDHLAPPLTRKQIRTTCDALEDLGFYARFRFSTGKVGGHMAYSFRHQRDELAKVVCDSVNFRDRAKIKANRDADAKKCLELLERAKQGPIKGQGGLQG